MTRKMILSNKLEMASHNLMCYSENYLMDTPKAGYEEQHKEAAAEVEILKAWLNEFHSTRLDSTREFIGIINGWGWSRTYDGHPLAAGLRFEVDTGDYYTHGDVRIFDIAPEVQHWFVGEDGNCGKYDIEKDRRYGRSQLVKITVDSIERVRRIEWAFEEE